MQPIRDYFFDKERIYLTVEGEEKVSKLSLSGSKIKHFLKEENEFQTWIKMCGIEEKKEKEWDTTDQENYSKLEQKVRDYLKRELNLDFQGYGFWENNFFTTAEPSPVGHILRGVPDGILWEKNKEIIKSVLEIKTSTQNAQQFLPGGPLWDEYFLQTAFYMYLSNKEKMILKQKLMDIYAY